MATNVLDTARFKYTVLNQMNYLNRREYIRNNEIPELPAAIPSNREELTGFIQQLFHYGLRKHMPGCPVRVNNNVLSLRLDGVQHRQAQEIRKMFEKPAIQDYLNEKNHNLYRECERNSSNILRNTSYVEFKTEEGRDFFHIPYNVQATNMREDNFSQVFESISKQGKSDEALSRHYEPIMELINRRTEERRREFIQNRTELNTDYVKAIIEAITIPFGVLEQVQGGAELVEACRAAGLNAFYKQPQLLELAKTEFVVDVYSDPSEEDETWFIKPVVPEIIESTPELTYHGQGTITAYDTDPTRSKQGLLPFEIQHCLRAGAKIEDFLGALPTSLLEKINASNEIYAQHIGGTSESLDIAALKAQVTAGTSRQEVNEMIQEVFGQEDTDVEEAVTQAQEQVVSSLTDSLLAQLQGQAQPVPDIDIDARPQSQESVDIADDDLPFSQEPVVIDSGAAMEAQVAEQVQGEVQESTANLIQRLQQQVAEQQARAREQHIENGYHDSHGTNPIFYVSNQEGIVTSYVAFNGNQAREFQQFNQACIYAGKSQGNITLNKFADRLTPLSEESNLMVLRFNGSLF